MAALNSDEQDIFNLLLQNRACEIARLDRCFSEGPEEVLLFKVILKSKVATMASDWTV
jgi:hypothetical protein